MSEGFIKEKLFQSACAARKAMDDHAAKALDANNAVERDAHKYGARVSSIRADAFEQIIAECGLTDEYEKYGEDRNESTGEIQ